MHDERREVNAQTIEQITARTSGIYPGPPLTGARVYNHSRPGSATTASISTSRSKAAKGLADT